VIVASGGPFDPYTTTWGTTVPIAAVCEGFIELSSEVDQGSVLRPLETHDRHAA